MCTTFQRKQGDNSPGLQTRLLLSDGTPIDLTGATVQLRARESNSNVTAWTRPAVITAALTGDCEYPLQLADTAAPAIYYLEWIVSFGGQTKIVPTNSFDIFEVTPNLA